MSKTKVKFNPPGSVFESVGYIEGFVEKCGCTYAIVQLQKDSSFTEIDISKLKGIQNET